MTLRARAKREGWVIGARRWREHGCTCSCSGDGLAQQLSLDCPHHGDELRERQREHALVYGMRALGYE